MTGDDRLNNLDRAVIDYMLKRRLKPRDGYLSARRLAPAIIRRHGSGSAGDVTASLERLNEFGHLDRTAFRGASGTLVVYYRLKPTLYI